MPVHVWIWPPRPRAITHQPCRQLHPPSKNDGMQAGHSRWSQSWLNQRLRALQAPVPYHSSWHYLAHDLLLLSILTAGPPNFTPQSQQAIQAFPGMALPASLTEISFPISTAG